MKNIMPFIAFLLLSINSINSQNVTTFIAGTPDDAIAIDNEGNIYCSNYVGNAVFKFTKTGQVSTFVSGLNSPNGLAFNSNEDLYICDGQANKIYVYDKNGVEKASYLNTGHPSGIIKSHDSDTMIFTEYLGGTINTLTPDGIIAEISSDPLLVGPVGLAYDENDQLYVGNFTNRKIYKVASNGTLTYVATVGNSSDLGFIAYANGSLWGTVLGEHKIYKINPNAIDDTEIYAGSTPGSKDGSLSEATFNQPNGITFNKNSDTIYITDFGSKNLRIIDMNSTTSNSDIKKIENGIAVYPNPTTETLSISTLSESIADSNLSIYDSMGQKVMSLRTPQIYNDIPFELNVSNLKTGAYILILSSKKTMLTQSFNILNM